MTPRSPRSGRAWVVAVLLLTAAAVASIVFYGKLRRGSEVDPGPLDRRIARELTAAHFENGDWSAAQAAIAPLVAGEEPEPSDLVAAALVEWELGDMKRVLEHLELAAKLDGGNAAVQYNLGQLALYELEFDVARVHFENAHRLAPDDLPTTLALAERVAEDDPARAEELYREVLEVGVDFAGSWYMVAIYRLGRLKIEEGEEDEGRELLMEQQRLAGRGLEAPRNEQLRRGELGRIPYPTPRANLASGGGVAPRFGDPVVVAPFGPGATGPIADLQVADADGDGRLDVFVWGADGLAVLHQAGDGGLEPRVLGEGPVDLAYAFDLGNDDDLDVVLARGGELALLEAEAPEGGRIEWRPSALALPALAAAPTDVQGVDFDHEGDLDLLFVGPFGARLLRNDGAAVAGGAFTDVTEEAGLPTGRGFTWCAIEDLDTDQDIDLVLGGGGPTWWADSLRGGRFADGSAALEAAPRHDAAPALADFDGDARPDLFGPGGLFANGPSATLRARGLGAAGAPADGTRVRAADVDLDGTLDAYGSEGGRLVARCAVGLADERLLALDVAASGRARLTRLAPLEGAPGLDLVDIDGATVTIRRGEQQGTHATRLAFRGGKDNRRAIGAVVEVRAGPVYRRELWDGVPVLVGVGESEELDYVRVTWPNGVVQYDVRRELADRTQTEKEGGILQPAGLVGSCPFLYAWNGTTYEFISDVLGITPLGLPMGPGMLVPPDHDEYVLVTGEQLVPRDGVLELQFTEELREVTYLDRVRLDVVDHPAGTELYPDERFCFPPFPDPEPHLVEAPLAPLSAKDGAGRDWTLELARIDADHAEPFALVEPQFLGLATPHTLELAFDAEAVRAAPRLRLVMTGWFFWTDASVNMASARHPERAFVPPIVEVPDGAGGWRPIGPPVGFPAGKTKTMLVDMTEHLVRDDPRVRISSTLRLYWDAIRLATDAGDAEATTLSLEPASAELWRRGFSAPERSEHSDRPARFEWDRLADLPRWNPHPGIYTKLGEALPLVTAIDDRFVIMASGDALTVRFDGTSLPPVRDGWRRDYLVFLDGWAKDRDPNTIEALYVEPLPFHGMSAYPYGADESFPDTEAHRAWRREWNTRPAEPWIPRHGGETPRRASAGAH